MKSVKLELIDSRVNQRNTSGSSSPGRMGVKELSLPVNSMLAAPVQRTSAGALAARVNSGRKYAGAMLTNGTITAMSR